MSNSRVYYGEYTLKHWIDLILQHNIELPDYQRSFVWGKEDVLRMINSLKEDLFVPPVTIAHYETTKEKKNLIVDGQQRLTSIFLFAIGFMPDRDKFDKEDITASGDDSSEEDDGSYSPIGYSIKWTFEELVKHHSSIEEIRNTLKNDERYKPLSIPNIVNIDDFLKQTFLGFSFIVPDTNRDQSKYFATLFRNINYWGVKLSPMESRRSLYYMNASLVKFFDGETSDDKDVLCDIFIQENLQPNKIDFVRYLSILSQYSIDKNANKVLVGYSAYSVRENFYADYVSYIVGIEQISRPEKFVHFDFEINFPMNCWQQRFDKIRDSIDSLVEKMRLESKGGHRMFTSWIDADYWLFGLLYIILFEGKDIDINKDALIEDIINAINIKKSNSEYAKSPNRLGHLRERIAESINIYNKHTQ